MKLIDAQKYLAAAYTAGIGGRFKFCDLPENLRGRTLFQQVVQELGYVAFEGNGYVWVDPNLFPNTAMQNESLEVYHRLVKAQYARKIGLRESEPKQDSPQKELADMEEAPTVPTATLAALNILAVNLQKVLRNQEAMAKEFGVKLPKWLG